MKHRATYLASLIVLTAASSYATILFRNAADLSNFTTANTSASAKISVVTTPTSALDGDAMPIYDDALQFSDTDPTKLSALYHQTGVALSDVVKISFDVVNFSTSGANSNFVFRVGPNASALGSASSSSFGIQLTTAGAVVAEQGANSIFKNAYTIGNRFNVTIFYNKSGAITNLSRYGGPSFLAANKWALYIDGVEKSSTLGEKASQTYGSSFGMVWLSGTGFAAATIKTQFDNIEYTNISATP